MPVNRKKTASLGGLDLGLGALVSAAEDRELPENDTAISQVVEVQAQDIAVGEEITQPSSANAFEELAQKRQWSELLDLAEKHLPGGSEAGTQSQDQTAEARIWWGRAQLEIGGLPGSILAAPLETVAQQLLASSANLKLKTLTAELLVEIVNKTGAEQDSLRLVNLLELAARLHPPFVALLLTRIAAELKSLEANPLRNQDKKCKLREGKLKALQLEFAGQVEPEAHPQEIRVEPEKQSSLVLQSTFWSGLRPRQLVGGAIFLALLLIFLLRVPSMQAEAARISLLTPEPKASVRLPEIVRVSNVSNLDALLYGLNASAKESGGQPAAATEASQPQVAAQAAGPLAQPSSSSEPAGPTVRPVVNTSGPVEGPEFLSIRSDISAGRGERVSASAAIPNTKRADELFGVPNPREELKTSGPSKGYVVEQFESDKTFRVISRTKVMVRPSFHTSSLAELEVGDKVKVESRAGPWLKLRSKRGQSGYILAQDAEVSESR